MPKDTTGIKMEKRAGNSFIFFEIIKKLARVSFSSTGRVALPIALVCKYRLQWVLPQV